MNIPIETKIKELVALYKNREQGKLLPEEVFSIALILSSQPEHYFTNKALSLLSSDEIMLVLRSFLNTLRAASAKSVFDLQPNEFPLSWINDPANRLPDGTISWPTEP